MLPYPMAAGMTNWAHSPLLSCFTAASHPGITCPTPTWKMKGFIFSKLECTSFPVFARLIL